MNESLENLYLQTHVCNIEEHYFLVVRTQVLGLKEGYNMENLGPVKWELALCLMAVFTLVYFAMWKGIKSSGKVKRYQM